MRILGLLFIAALLAGQGALGWHLAAPTPGEQGSFVEVPCREFFEQPRDGEVRLVGCRVRTSRGRVEVELGLDATQRVWWTHPSANLQRRARFMRSLSEAKRARWLELHSGEREPLMVDIEADVDGIALAFWDDDPIYLRPVGRQPETRAVGAALFGLSLIGLGVVMRALWRSTRSRRRSSTRPRVF